MLDRFQCRRKITYMKSEFEPDMHIIISKARELGLLVAAHPLTASMQQCKKELQADKDASDLLNELVSMGHSLDEGLQVPDHESWEYSSLKQRLDTNPLVIRHIRAQRAWLNMIRTIQEHMLPAADPAAE